MDNTWTIGSQDTGKRFDHFLNEKLVDTSRSQIQKRIKKGSILINGQSVAVHTFLKEGDEITYEKNSDTAIENDAAATKVELPELEVVEETDSFLIINKPVGVLVHPDSKQKEGTLVDMILEKYPGLSQVGGRPERAAIVHRLDKDVSGLMVVPKTEQAYEYFKHLFKQRLIHKTYIAFVYGEPPQNEGDIRFRIARSTTSARMAARPEQEDSGKAAWTHYRVIERFRGATLLEAQIVSGRTHQIRAHFLALGNPIIGDQLYKAKHTTRNIQAPRLMLQSVGLEFTDPETDEKRMYKLEPDPSFQILKEELS